MPVKELMCIIFLFPELPHNKLFELTPHSLRTLRLLRGPLVGIAQLKRYAQKNEAALDKANKTYDKNIAW